MANIFKKLIISDIVATVGSKCFKKLTTEETTTNKFILADGSTLVTSDGKYFIAKEE